MSDQGKSRWQVEFDALPEWVQMMVRASTSCAAHGKSHRSDILHLLTKGEYAAFQVALSDDDCTKFMEGFWHMLDLSKALTAPWPPPAPPVRERRAFNIVELMSDEMEDEDGGFDQPCCFGNRVGGYAVYCHNEGWPGSPRKCRRNRDDHKHEDCPGFVANPDAK